jgi:pilus assembly protein FimV
MGVATEAYKLIAKSQHWQKTAIAVAASTLLAFTSTGALALSLGRISVQSALGEPLRAEIDIADINAEEAASLRSAVAQPDVFAAAGLEYNAALTGLQATLQRRPDGRAFIRLSSDRPVNDPFMDLILETNWSSGRIVRDYTLLFDPPSLRKPATVAPTLPQVQTSTAPRPSTAPVTAPSDEAPRTTPAASATPKAKSTSSSRPDTPSSSTSIVVKPGDTASKIAGNLRENGVSLDQMLVALLRGNPDAFVNNNINRLRSGAVINAPSTEQAQSVSSAEANRILRAQSKDFDGFKRSLASTTPSTTVVAADRKTSGTIDSKVVDSKVKPATPDKLTLSKGAVQSKNDDAKLAKERADKEAAARAAELAKNISDLKKAGAAVSAVSSPSPATKVTASSAPVITAAPIAASAPVASPAVSAALPIPPVVSPIAVAPVSPPPAPVAEPSLVDDLLENPLIPAAGVGLLALLGGFGVYRMRQRKNKGASIDSSFLESRLQPDSFFGASGGQRVDTNSEGPASGSSMVYSASQLDAADDVDPVAEADVYLAYGRDMQAEEILKEAAKTNPARLAIHTKLLEIYAKRKDAANYEASAVQAHKLTGSDSADWSRICETGLGIDPSNSLYQPGGDPASVIPSTFNTPSFASTIAVPNSNFGENTTPTKTQAATASAPGVDLDLDFDFSIDDKPASAISDVTGGKILPTASYTAEEPTVKLRTPVVAVSDALDFDMSGPTPIATDSTRMGLPSGGTTTPDFLSTNTMPVEPTSTLSDSLKSQSGMLEFDMGALSLDLEPSTAANSASQQLSDAPDSMHGDPLETKLALAEEFVSIGDEDGARALIEEVVAEATGEMRAKAQRALANLS